MICSISFIPNALADNYKFFASVGYGSINPGKGYELTSGLGQNLNEDFILELVPLSGVFIPNDESKYSSEKTSDGKDICRDKQTGKFAEKSNCESVFKYGLQVLVKYKVHQISDVGLGLRFGSGTSLFVQALLRFGLNYSFEGKIGNEYLSLALRMDFP